MEQTKDIRSSHLRKKNLYIGTKTGSKNKNCTKDNNVNQNQDEQTLLLWLTASQK